MWQAFLFTCRKKSNREVCVVVEEEVNRLHLLAKNGQMLCVPRESCMFCVKFFVSVVFVCFKKVVALTGFGVEADLPMSHTFTA